MAASPLADIDWDNLTGAESNLAMGLLQRAFNERLVVARINSRQHDPEIINFYPFPDDNPTNDATWGKTGTASAWHWSLWKDRFAAFGGLAISRLCYHYADIQYINANINTVIPALQGQFSEDNLNLSPAKVFAYIGITDWPAMVNPNAIEIKQWYDILCLFTHVFTSDSAQGRGAISGTLVKKEWSGIFAGTSGTGFPGTTTYIDGGSPSIPDLTTDWAQLYTGPRVRELMSNSEPINDTYVDASLSVSGILYDIIAARRYITINNQDLTDTGYTRVPKETVCWGQWETSGDATYLANNGIVDLKLISFSCTSVRTAATVEYQATDAPFSLPSFSGGDEFRADKHMRFFDNWNDPTGATGFQFYTP